MPTKNRNTIINVLILILQNRAYLLYCKAMFRLQAQVVQMCFVCTLLWLRLLIFSFITVWMWPQSAQSYQFNQCMQLYALLWIPLLLLDETRPVQHLSTRIGLGQVLVTWFVRVLCPDQWAIKSMPNLKQSPLPLPAMQSGSCWEEQWES